MKNEELKMAEVIDASDRKVIPMYIETNIQNVIINEEELLVVSSRDIAEALGKQHKNVIRDLDNIIATGVCSDLSQPKIISSTYTHPQNGQEYREYLLTKDGFTLYMFNIQGHNNFKLAYIDKFNEMEAKIKNKQEHYFDNLSTEMKTILMLDIKHQENKKRIKDVRNDLEDFKDNAPLFNIECEELQAEVKRIALKVLGGKNANAYKHRPTSVKVFKDIQRQLKREFNVNKYKAIKRKDLEKAKEILKEYKLPVYLKEEVELLNNQITRI